jgi:hypothetical protein
MGWAVSGAKVCAVPVVPQRNAASKIDNGPHTCFIGFPPIKIKNL